MKRLPHHFLPCLIAILAVAIVWLFKGATDQELLANAAKAMDFTPWVTWWTYDFLGGASLAPELSTIMTLLPLKLGVAIFGPALGAKLAALVATALGAWGIFVFLRRWTQDDLAAGMGACAYILGPQLALRLAGNEHMPVVFCLPWAPWLLWAILVGSDSGGWRGATLITVTAAGMSLAFTKLAVCFAPFAVCFAAYLYLTRPASRDNLARSIIRATGMYILLAVVPLLPALREVQWLAMFRFDPFSAWQQNFSLKSVLSWIDRGNILQQGMSVGFVVDQGGFYVGVVTLAVGFVAWWRTVRIAEATDSQRSLLAILKLLFGMLLFLSWLSAGPRSIAQGMLEFLKNGSGAPDLTIPVFWIVMVGQCVLLWKVWPEHKNRDYARIAALLIYLTVPGFRLYELLPFARDIRAPWSVWQVGGSLVIALLFGVGSALLLRVRKEGMLSSGALALFLIILLIGDFSVYLLRYGMGALPGSTYPAFEQICSQLRLAPAGNVYPLSGRYFYLRIPALTGKPIEQEAFNSYFGLAWRRVLQNASMSSPEAMRAGMSLLGCSYIFIDKQDPNTPANLQQTLRSLYPVLMENEFFAVLINQQTLYPAFLAKDFVALPPESYAMAPAVLQLLPQNIITVEMGGVDRNMPGFAGMAKGPNQIELLQQYQGKAGQPFGRVPLVGNRMDDYQRMTYQLPPTVSGWLVVSEAYHPDWTVTIDGKPAQTTRAEAALLGTFVPAGSHEVTFQFKAPAWYSLCLALGTLSWIVALVALLYLPSKWAPAKWREWWVGSRS